MPRHQWKKGESGNPGGRRREDGRLRDLARSHAPAMLSRLVEIALNGKTEGACVTAAIHVLDRAMGKVPVMGERLRELPPPSLARLAVVQLLQDLGSAAAPPPLIEVVAERPEVGDE